MKCMFSITQYALGLHGIFQVKFVKDKKRWLVAAGLLLTLLVCTGLDVLGDNAVIYRMIVEIVAAMLVFDDKKRDMAVKYLCVFFSVTFVAAPVELVLAVVYRAFPAIGAYVLLDTLDEIFITVALALIAYFLKNKESGLPDSRAGARLRQQPLSLGAKCASPGGFYVIGNEVSYNIKGWWKEYLKNAPLKFFCMELGLGFCATCFRGFVYLYGEQMPEKMRLLFEIVCVCLVEFILLFGVGLILLSKLKEQYQRESMLKSEIMEVSKQYYGSLKENIREIRKIRHDMNAHLELLCSLLEDGKADEAALYLDKVMAKTKKAGFSIIEVGNEFVNAVLSNESMKMPEDVTFVCEGKIPAGISLKEYEMCTVFANLVSNAREACERVKSHKKEICLQIKQNKGHLVIVIENPVEWEVDVEHLEGATTKENDKEHGYGLQNVREIVLKYQGEMNYEVREGRFVVEVLI